MLDRGYANFSELRLAELRRIPLPRTPVNSRSAYKTSQEISRSLGRSAGFIFGCVRGANLVTELAGGWLVHRSTPAVFAVPLHGCLVRLPIRGPAQHDRSPVVGLGRALVVVDTSTYLKGLICSR